MSKSFEEEEKHRMADDPEFSICVTYSELRLIRDLIDPMNGILHEKIRKAHRVSN